MAVSLNYATKWNLTYGILKVLKKPFKSTSLNVFNIKFRFWRIFKCSPLLWAPCYVYAVGKNRGCMIGCPNNFLLKLHEKTKKNFGRRIKIGCLETEIWIFKNAWKWTFFIPSRGVCGGGVVPQGLKINMENPLPKHYNVSKFESILRDPPTKLLFQVWNHSYIWAIPLLFGTFCRGMSWNGPKFWYVVVLENLSLCINFQPPGCIPSPAMCASECAPTKNLRNSR